MWKLETISEFFFVELIFNFLKSKYVEHEHAKSKSILGAKFQISEIF